MFVHRDRERPFFDAIRNQELSQNELVARIQEGMKKMVARQPEIDFNSFPFEGGTMKLTPDMLVPEETVGFSGPLSNKGILRHLFLGDIDIFPFNPLNLGANAYDVTLGDSYYRFKATNTEEGQNLFIHNPYSRKHSKDIWYGPEKAVSLTDLKEILEEDLSGIKESDKVILLHSGEMILGHTEEVVHNRGCISVISARSSTGRNLITICEDSFLIQYGFRQRITLEVKSKFTNSHWLIPLVAGRRYAQLQFFLVEPPLFAPEERYSDTERDIVDIYNNWDPSSMLPQMWKDREVDQAQ